MELKGSKTEKNLMTAFAGESEARNKYTYYASKAKKDGFEQVSKLFEATANNEKEHAKLWFKLLKGGNIPSTIDNLLDAAEGENYEWTDMYAEFAKVAKDQYLRNKTRQNRCQNPPFRSSYPSTTSSWKSARPYARPWRRPAPRRRSSSWTTVRPTAARRSCVRSARRS